MQDRMAQGDGFSLSMGCGHQNTIELPDRQAKRCVDCGEVISQFREQQVVNSQDVGDVADILGDKNE